MQNSPAVEGPSRPRRPSLWEALVPLAALALLLGVGFGVLRYPVEVLLLGAAAVAGAVGYRLGYRWPAMEEGIVRSLSTAMPAILVLVSVGALIASWIAAGTIPLLIYFGLELISPRFFLLSACVICSIVSLSTGTSWGTAGTVGVALMGVAGGLGVPLGAAAGAVISGAYFGDKLSPFSDTTNLAPVVAGSELFEHIRWMLWTTLPAWSLGLLVYLVVGLGTRASAPPDITAIQEALSGAFAFHVLLLAPPLVILWSSMTRRPALPGILLSSAVAIVLSVWIPGRSAARGPAEHGFRFCAGYWPPARGLSPGSWGNAEHDGYRPGRLRRFRIRWNHERVWPLGEGA